MKKMKRSFFDLYIQLKNIIQTLNSDKTKHEEKIKDIPEYVIVTELPKVNIPRNYKMFVNKKSLISIKNFTENKCI